MNDFFAVASLTSFRALLLALFPGCGFRIIMQCMALWRGLDGVENERTFRQGRYQAATANALTNYYCLT